MKITLDLENLQEIIETVSNKNIESAIKECTKEIIKDEYDELFKKTVESSVNRIISNSVDEYIKSTKVRIGNSWDDEEIKEYSIEEYVKKKINDFFQDGKLYIEIKDRYGSTIKTPVTLEGYVKHCLEIDKVIKPYIDKITKGLKEEVNEKVKSTFDESLRNTLAENVFSIITAGDTYRTIVNNMKLLGE